MQTWGAACDLPCRQMIPQKVCKHGHRSLQARRQVTCLRVERARARLVRRVHRQRIDHSIHMLHLHLHPGRIQQFSSIDYLIR